jgi:PAS domain S-box-containing protein
LASPNPTGDGFRFRQSFSYGCAIVLPLLSGWITVNTPALYRIPFALSFSVIAGLAALSGPWPALLAILVSILSFNVFSPFAPLGFSFAQVERSVVLLTAAFFITFLSWKQRSAENKFRFTLESLQERTDALTQAQQASELATWLFNADTMKTYWDEGSKEIFGRPFADLGGRALPMEFVVPEDRDRLRESVEASTQSGQPLRTEFRVQWPNAEIHWVEARGTKVSDSPNLWRGATFDITRRKIVEAALIRSEKLAAMGRLASTVAHEVNNPLESVTNLLYLIATDPDLKESTRSYITLAEEELARLANITRLTLTFARSASVRAPVNVA